VKIGAMGLVTQRALIIKYESVFITPFYQCNPVIPGL